MIKFRDYQEDIISRGVQCLKANGFVYLAMEVRTGKTLTSLGICAELGAKKVLFLTKKKAISSIQVTRPELCHVYYQLRKYPQDTSY